MKKIIFLFLVALYGCNSDRPTIPYTILKVVKVDDLTKMDVSIPGRLTKQQMLDISAQIKMDSAQYENLQLDYILPNNNYTNTGGVIVYATAAYRPVAKATAADTIRDYNDKILSFEYLGIDPSKAQKLLSIEPAEMVGKALLGKFIDDDLKTISLIYTDAKDEKYILELDTTGQVVSAVMPKVVNHNGIDKMVITEHGDYMTLKDSILTMYSSEAPEKPYRTLKKGL
jgi:hypothetical protein